MDRQQADALVSELASALGIPELALDERGAATLGIGDEQVVVSLGYNATASSIDLMVCLDEIDPSDIQIATLLEANFGWLATEGAAFACLPGSGVIVLQRRCTAGQLRTRGLVQQVQNMADLAQAWSRQLMLQSSASVPMADIDDLAMASSRIVMR